MSIMDKSHKLVALVVFVESEDRGNPSSGKVYQYLVPDYLEATLRPGDLAVVIRSNDASAGIPKTALVRVDEVRTVESFGLGQLKAHAELKARVDMEPYLAKRQAALRRAELLAELGRLEAKRQERARFLELAATDPQAAELLKQLDDVDGVK